MPNAQDRAHIGITASRQTIDTSVGPMPFFVQPVYYAEAVLAAGGIPLILPPSQTWRPEILDFMDGLIVSGGEDVEPGRYGQTPHPTVEWIDPVRDEFEIAIVRYAFERDRPLLGVCRGAQVLNVAAGGTLVQDLASRHQDLGRHSATKLDEVVHDVEIAPDSRLRDAVGSGRISVNSGHHQAIQAISALLKPVAWAADGVVEAAESPNHSWIVGVQWHPEMLYEHHAEHLRLFEAFVRAALESRQSPQG
jgi:putative glutamine amidotransferase